MRTLKEQATSLLHVSNLFHNAPQGLLAEKLVKASGLSRAFFCNSGTEANEAALKFCRLVNPGRSRVVALVEGFHGRTFGSVSITGHDAYRTPFEPLVPGAVFVEPNDVAALEAAVTPETSAIFLEPIQGEGGVVPLTTDYLKAARAIADKTGAVLVFDEIQCGLGRTGKLFAFQNHGVVPDVVTLAKPIGGGLPLGVVLTGPRFEGALKPSLHGTTFGGNPLACRLGLEVLDEIEEKGILEDVASIGEWFGKKLRSAKRKNKSIVDVRGTGLMWGIELDREAGPVATALRSKGFVVGTSRTHVLRLLPPYVVPKAALRGFIEALESILAEGKP